MYIQRKEAEGSVVKKLFGQGEQVQETPDANEGGTFNLSKKLQEKSTPTPRAWRLYLGKETIKEGSGVGMILVSPDENMHSYAICLKFNAFDHVIDCEALLAGLATSISKGKVVQERNYGAIASFHRFRITHLPKIINSKAEVLTRLAIIKLEFLNQEVLVGIKTRPSVEETSSSKMEKAVPGEAIRLRVGGMTQNPLDGKPHIYSQFSLSSEQQVFSGISHAPPLTENGLKKRKEGKN
ncbi:hypothetical protein Tco_0266839 [Tanacetum coccineum]